MRLLLRFSLPLLIVLAILAGLLTPVAEGLIARWFEQDLQLRSRLIFSSVRDSLSRLMLEGSSSDIEALFNRIAEDERVLAVGRCAGDGGLPEASRSWPRSVSCPKIPAEGGTVFASDEIRNLLLASFPLATGAAPAERLVILHDRSFIASRNLDARLYLMGFLVLLGVTAAGITLAVAHFTLRRWIKSLRNSLQGNGNALAAKEDAPIAPVIAEIRQLLRDLDISRRTATGIRVDWSPDTLRRVLESELPGAEVVVLSNREPYIHRHAPDGRAVVQRPASGVVTALEPIMRACGGTWVAHGSGDADRVTVDARDRVRVPPEDPSYTLRRVWLSEEEQDGYYYGLANEGLWPLCHLTFVRPTFRESDWETYVAVNRKFAAAVIREATRPDPIVLVQDYHFALVPRMLRAKLPQATIITFWHIPWPNPEVFGICPWREKILDGLFGSSIVGFHTQLHCNNFIETADRFMECHIDRERATVSIGGRSTLIRPYPISIDWPPSPLERQASVTECRAAVFARHNLPADTLLGVGVERFDFTKGIPDRLRAVEILLEKHPEWIGRFVLLQICAPTRGKLSSYREIREETEATAARINARFSRGTYRPVILIVEHHEADQVYELFRAADLCLVSSLHDGMNLVAKEFVAARDDGLGVLILSTFAGASRELMEALIVNPFDARATAEAIDTALRMPRERQAERMQFMRDLVSENNVYYWAGRMLLDASRIRKRERIESGIAAAAGRSERLRRGWTPAASQRVD